MRSWALDRLRCLRCRGRLAQEAAGAVVSCPSCRAVHAVQEDVTDFLGTPNPVVERERTAVSRLDGDSSEGASALAVLLRRLEAGLLTETEAAERPCLLHALESRAQIQEVLSAHPLAAGAVLVELGADHCWASGLFLDAGCRVIAVDISDHLRLAPRGDDPQLCRLKADMNVLPLADGSADVVWATSAAHHSWDLGRTFQEAARVLRPGGRLVFCCEPMPSWIRYPFGRDFGHQEKALGINETWIPRSAWLDQCARAGLQGRLMFPALARADIERRLRARKLPRVLAGLLRPVLPAFQVSIHLLATKA